MKKIAIFMWVGLLLLFTSHIPPGLWAYVVIFVFFFVFEYARRNNKMGLAIIFFILGCLTIPVAVIIELFFKNN